MGIINPKVFVVSTVVTAGVIYAKPDLLPERFSRKIVRFVIFDVVLALFYTLFIYPFFFNPLRHIPGPKVSSFVVRRSFC